MDVPTSGPEVLVIGLDPRRVPGPWDPEPMVAAIEAGDSRLAAHGVRARTCLIGVDGSDDVEVVVGDVLRSRPWRCVVVGGGLRAADDQVELFELIINLVHRCAPHAAIAFNRTPAETLEAVARWIDVPGDEQQCEHGG